MKPRLFIGSSREGHDVATGIHANLAAVAECTIWDKGVFDPSGSVIPDLLAEIDDTDFCVLVFSPDDIATIRGQQFPVVRDNVLFELGLSVGRVGLERSFFLVPDNTLDLHLPTDLSGITTGRYEAGRRDGNWQAATTVFCTTISRVVRSLGFLQGPRQRRLDDLAIQYACCEWIVDSLTPAPGTRRWERKAAIFRRLVDACKAVPVNKRELAGRRFAPFGEPGLDYMAASIVLAAAVGARPEAGDVELIAGVNLAALPDGNARICAYDAATGISDLVALSPAQVDALRRWMLSARSSERFVYEAAARLRDSLARHPA